MVTVRDFDEAIVIEDRLKGSINYQNERSMVVVNSMSGSVSLCSLSGSILVAGKISGSVNLVARNSIIVRGKISGSGYFLARTGDIFIMDKVSGSTVFDTPYGRVFYYR